MPELASSDSKVFPQQYFKAGIEFERGENDSGTG